MSRDNQPLPSSENENILQQAWPKVKSGTRILASKSVDDSTLSGKNTPFRLPRLASSLPLPLDDDSERVQMDLPTVKLDFNGLSGARSAPTLRTVRHPPYTDVQLRRSQLIHTPKFKTAHFAPQDPTLAKKHVPDACLSPYVHRISLGSKNDVPSIRFSRSAYLPQSEPPSLSQHKVWRLSPHPHTNFDAQAVRGCIGPYSREFVVHCSTPKTWLRMKLSKERSSVT